MPKVKKYSDLGLNWITTDHGEKWLQWQHYCAEWIAVEDAALGEKLVTIKHFIQYLNEYAPYAYEPARFFIGNEQGHMVSSEEFDDFLRSKNVSNKNDARISRIINLLDFILQKHFLDTNDYGAKVPMYRNPLIKIKRIHNLNETVQTPLPYRFIQQLRHILCPYPESGDAPWDGRHFKDWKWAIDNLEPNASGWVEVPQENLDKIDYNDPDCVPRTRVVKRKNQKILVHEIWCPVAAMALFVKLHLPLRTFQVRFLDSGEGDAWRYQRVNWIKNTRHGFSDPDRAKGVFKRLYEPCLSTYSTGMYISTNKTADRNKEDYDRGFVIPWQHDELLYWLEKLRNWQEKYNPITRLTSGLELTQVHTCQVKSKSQLQAMGDFAFLFRDPTTINSENHKKPISQSALDRAWYELLKKLELDVYASGQTLKDGTRLRFVCTSDQRQPTKTEFSLHSLFVSLITCYCLDTDLPIPVVSKLLAGHSRLFMTFYYNKLTPSVMAQKMSEAHDALDECAASSLKNFLADAEANQIELRCAFNTDKYNSAITALGSKNPICWEQKPLGLCLVGGNSGSFENLKTIGGCWNGGQLTVDCVKQHDRLYAPVPHGPENCVQCRWFITDASYLYAITAHLNFLSYQIHETAKHANIIEKQLNTLKNEQYNCENNNQVFLKFEELHTLTRRYEKHIVEADLFTQDYQATFSLIWRLIQIEKKRTDGDNKQKLIAVGSEEDVRIGFEFFESESEFHQLSWLCEDAEFYPDLHDSLRKTPAIEKRNTAIVKMLSRAGFEPIILELDHDTALRACNAMMRKMSITANSTNKYDGFRIAANYVEAEKYLIDSKLLEVGLQAAIDVAHTPILMRKKLKKIAS